MTEIISQNPITKRGIEPAKLSKRPSQWFPERWANMSPKANDIKQVRPKKTKQNTGYTHISRSYFLIPAWKSNSYLYFRKLPQKISLGNVLGNNLRSCRGTTTPSMLPNIVERPRQKSMTKKRTDQRGETGILMMASVNTMKARPVPSTPWESIHQFQPLTLVSVWLTFVIFLLITELVTVLKYSYVVMLCYRLTWLRKDCRLQVFSCNPWMISGLVWFRWIKTSS